MQDVPGVIYSVKKEHKIVIGTSGFSYPDWIKVFYPADLPKDQWLAYYAEHFPFCELNFSYYRMPTPENMEKYLKVPLEFALKAHRSLTHDRVETTQARQDFREAARVLHAGGVLSATLMQFPFSFKYSPENRKYLLNLLEFLSDLPLVVEFRNPQWIKESVFEELKKNGWAISMLDSPELAGGMPAFDVVTAPIAYLRFHGRNQANWWKGNNVSRYDYEYNQAELESWIPRIQHMSIQAKTTYISFNNHARGQAIKNANQLHSLLANAELI